MNGTTLEALRIILATCDLARLINLHEDLFLEAKGKTVYDPESANDRFELAKDVSAFANSHGGYIIIGLKTERLTGQRIDKIVDLDLITEAEFPISRYQGIIREYIHPPPDSIESRWVEHSQEPGKGVGYIFIPPQNEESKYFLIAHEIDGRKIKQIVFGIARRIWTRLGSDL